MSLVVPMPGTPKITKSETQRNHRWYCFSSEHKMCNKTTITLILRSTLLPARASRPRYKITDHPNNRSTNHKQEQMNAGKTLTAKQQLKLKLLKIYYDRPSLMCSLFSVRSLPFDANRNSPLHLSECAPFGISRL